MHRSGNSSALTLNLALLVFATLASPQRTAAQHEHQSPYTGHERMEISSLSSDELRELEAGEGMGLARAAELNHYPGPKHALEMAAELGLSTGQADRLTEIRDAVSELAVAKGEEIIVAERELTELFRAGEPDDAVVHMGTTTLGVLYGELRAIHLVAHLRTAAVMTDHQIDLYDQQRGYRD